MRAVVIESLEKRRLLSAVIDLAMRPQVAHPTIRFPHKPGQVVPLSSSSPYGFFPSEIRQAYGFDTLLSQFPAGNGAGQTIAIIDAYDNPKFVSSSSAGYDTSDLYYFNQQFGLPQFGTPGGPFFTKMDQNGGSAYPAGNTGWGDEIALDVEWAHALAPMANIVLIEANDPSYANLVSSLGANPTGAVVLAKTFSSVSVVSMSFGGSEFNSPFGRETDYDSTFTTPAGHSGITFIASSGDNGSPGLYPAYSPNVLAVGGTSLTLSGGAYVSETTWSGSGGGKSKYESKPSYQSSITLSTTKRMIPDIAFDADPNTGVAIYDSYSQGNVTPWVKIGGTSLSAPCWAALIAITNQGRALAGLGTLNGRNDTLPKLYGLAAGDFHDITTGSNGGFSALVGYDLTTGRGTPLVAKVVKDLAAAAPSVPVLAAASDSGISSSDRITNVTHPVFTGTAPASVTVQILSDGVVVGSGTSTAGGAFSIATTSALTDGTHAITAAVGLATSASSLSVTIDTVGPALLQTDFVYDTAQKLTVQFSETLATNLGMASMSVVADPSEAIVPLSGFSSLGTSAEFFFPGLLLDGNYTASLDSGLTDAAGNPLTGNVPFQFFILTGDANHDRRVDLQDVYTVASNWGSTAGTFSTGDFNYDGTVDSIDLGLLSTRWGTVLLPA